MVTFEQLGVDSLMVDEAHAFKNLAVLSKMRNVAGHIPKPRASAPATCI